MRLSEKKYHVKSPRIPKACMSVEPNVRWLLRLKGTVVRDEARDRVVGYVKDLVF